MSRARVDSRELQSVVTGRRVSYFQDDINRSREQLLDAFGGKDVAISGAAGTIATATIRELLAYRPNRLLLMDSDENALVDLIRTLRTSTSHDTLPILTPVVLDVSSELLPRVLDTRNSIDALLNFAAVKHVRSERDAVSLLRMFQVNVLAMAHMVRAVEEREAPCRVFSVSTDKAANPVNFMGASKRLMEEVMFRSLLPQSSTARFANVAFSRGSLLESWLDRIARGEPVPVPTGTRRYFVSKEESGQLCVLAAGGIPSGRIAIPNLDPRSNLVLLEDVLMRVLQSLGLAPIVVEDESEALKLATVNRQERGECVVLRTSLNTEGEKEFEEFVGTGDTLEECELTSVGVVRPSESEVRQLESLITWLEEACQDPTLPARKGQLAERIALALPDFRPHTSGLKLDDRV